MILSQTGFSHRKTHIRLTNLSDQHFIFVHQVSLAEQIQLIWK